MRMGGKAAPFGVDEENLREVIEVIDSFPWMQFQGIHLFSGTQILDCQVLLGQYQAALDIARRVVDVTHRPLRTLDFGGGLGIPYFAGEQELDMGTVKKGLSAMISDFKSHSMFSETRCIVEPGRFLVGEAGVYVVRITDIKGLSRKEVPCGRWRHESSFSCLWQPWAGH